MANKYAYNKEVDEAKTARAMAKSLKISPKHSVEICSAIRGMEVGKAKAEYKGMDTEKLVIEHISSHKGVVIPGYIPRAFGRMTPFNTPTTHIQIVLQEAN